MGSPVRGDNHTSDPVTPCLAMRKAVRSVLAPAQSNVSEEILMNKTRKRTRVQAKTREVLTSDICEKNKKNVMPNKRIQRKIVANH